MSASISRRCFPIALILLSLGTHSDAPKGGPLLFVMMSGNPHTFSDTTFNFVPLSSFILFIYLFIYLFINFIIYYLLIYYLFFIFYLFLFLFLFFIFYFYDFSIH